MDGLTILEFLIFYSPAIGLFVLAKIISLRSRKKQLALGAQKRLVSFPLIADVLYVFSFGSATLPTFWIIMGVMLRSSFQSF